VCSTGNSLLVSLALFPGHFPCAGFAVHRFNEPNARCVLWVSLGNHRAWGWSWGPLTQWQLCFSPSALLEAILHGLFLIILNTIFWSSWPCPLFTRAILQGREWRFIGLWHLTQGHPACPSDNLGGLSPNPVLYVLDTPTVSTLPAGNMEIFFIFAWFPPQWVTHFNTLICFIIGCFSNAHSSSTSNLASESEPLL
jgi:hypothetical protein